MLAYSQVMYQHNLDKHEKLSAMTCSRLCAGDSESSSLTIILFNHSMLIVVFFNATHHLVQ